MNRAESARDRASIDRCVGPLRGAFIRLRHESPGAVLESPGVWLLPVRGYVFHALVDSRVGPDTLPLIVHRNGKSWTVTEPTTGHAVCSGAKSRNDAMRDAQRISGRSPGAVRAAADRWLLAGVSANPLITDRSPA